MNKWTRVNFQPNLPLHESGRVTAGKEHIQLSKEAAKEGMVLLKNENNVLPLKKGSRIALFGKGSFDYVKGGGGSGDVTVSFFYFYLKRNTFIWLVKYYLLSLIHIS